MKFLVNSLSVIILLKRQQEYVNEMGGKGSEKITIIERRELKFCREVGLYLKELVFQVVCI